MEAARRSLKARMEALEKRVEALEKRIEALEADMRVLITSVDSLRNIALLKLVEAMAAIAKK